MSRKSETEKYQDKVVSKLKRVFGKHNVRKKWNVAKNSQDKFTRKLYCPEIDVVVGPFNINEDVNYNNQLIDKTISKNRRFIEKLIAFSETGIGNINSFLETINKNPRCFLAIEIEKSGSRKHLLGDIANASIIGSIGIVVPLNEGNLRAFKRIKEYVNFATAVKKINPIFNNVLVINKDNFIKAISSRKTKQ